MRTRLDTVIARILQEMGIPAAYDHFDRESAPVPPLAVYRRVRGDSIIQDGVVKYRVPHAYAAIYSDDPEELYKLMIHFEQKLTEADLVYSLTADTTFLDEEGLYMSSYDL